MTEDSFFKKLQNAHIEINNPILDPTVTNKDEITKTGIDRVFDKNINLSTNKLTWRDEEGLFSWKNMDRTKNVLHINPKKGVIEGDLTEFNSDDVSYMYWNAPRIQSFDMPNDAYARKEYQKEYQSDLNYAIKKELSGIPSEYGYTRSASEADKNVQRGLVDKHDYSPVFDSNNLERISGKNAGLEQFDKDLARKELIEYSNRQQRKYAREQESWYDPILSLGSMDIDIMNPNEIANKMQESLFDAFDAGENAYDWTIDTGENAYDWTIDTAENAYDLAKKNYEDFDINDVVKRAKKNYEDFDINKIYKTAVDINNWNVKQAEYIKNKAVDIKNKALGWAASIVGIGTN